MRGPDDDGEEEERFVDEVAEKGEYLIRPWGYPTPVRLLFIFREELSWVLVPSILLSDASLSSYFCSFDLLFAPLGSGVSGISVTSSYHWSRASTWRSGSWLSSATASEANSTLSFGLEKGWMALVVMLLVVRVLRFCSVHLWPLSAAFVVAC